mgnify:CR=1 FL=1
MKGTYVCYLNGEKVSESSNVITTEGKNAILRYLAGMVPSYARSIALGTDTTAATVDDTDLGFEFTRETVNLGTVDVSDPAHKKVIFKASFPTGLAMNIKEMGLFSFDKNPASGTYTGTVLTQFDDSETWTTTTGNDLTSVNLSDGSLNCIGDSSRISQQDTDGDTVTFTLDFTDIDLSGYSATDEIGIAIGTYSSDATTLILTLTDIDGDAVSTSWTIPAYSAGTPYRIFTVAKGDLNNASFNWSQVDKISVGITATTDNNSKTVSNVARSAGGVVTLTTSANHGFAINDIVTVSNLTNDSSSFNGSFTITATPSGTTLTYDQTGNTVTTEAATGTSPTAVAQGWKISNVARTSNVTTLTTTIAHSIVEGQYFYVGNVGNSADVNGTYIAKAGTTGSTIIYDNTGSNIVSAAATGTGPYVEIQNKLLLDGIRVFDSDVNNPDYILVSRTIPTPIYKDANSVLDVEYRLEVAL